MASDRETRLVLWDIDNTLIESRGVGRAIYERVFPSVIGRPLNDLATVHGRTELDIMQDTLRLHGIEPTDSLVNQLSAALAEGYRAAVGELAQRGRVLPGVWEALDAFEDELEIHQGLLTGNTTDVARIKLESFGLDRYLDPSLGAYGDDNRDRAELVAIARGRAEQRLGNAISVDQVVLIGDTPNDVNAALSSGAHIIAVASGRYSVDDLRNAGAEATLESLSSLPQLRQALRSR